MDKMNIKDDAIRSKLALLQLAKELGSISKACQIMGYSRDSYYRFKKLYEAGGDMALQNIKRTKPVLKNRVDPELEKRVVEFALDYPNHGQAKVSEIMTRQGFSISPSGVRAVWKRHDLESKNKRLRALHARVEQNRQELSPEQRDEIEKMHLLSQDTTDVDSQYPGNLGVQDTFDLGEIKGLGHLYQQTFVDAYCKYAIAQLYIKKDAETSIDLLSELVLPWYQSHELSLEQVLTDRGGEFFTETDGNSYQEMLKQHSIRHIKMRAYNGPEINGICARFHKVLMSEFYEPILRTKTFTTVDELNQALQAWLADYNQSRPHQERYCFGNTPEQTLAQSLHLAQK